MQKLTNEQLKRVDEEIQTVQFQIEQLQNSISDDNVLQLKKNFVNDQIKQLIVVKNYLCDLKQKQNLKQE